MDEPDLKLSNIVQKTFRIPATIICVATYVFQAYVMDHFLVTKYGDIWLLWIIADIIVLALLLATLITSSLYLLDYKIKGYRPWKILGGELPLVYISWLVYSLVLASKVTIIFNNFAYELTEKNFFGPNLLKTNISLTCIIFFLLVLTHSDAESDSARSNYLLLIISRVTTDILDTVSLLDVFFIELSHVFLSFELSKAILGITFVNLVLPTVPLAVLSWTQFGRSEAQKVLNTLHIVLYLVAVNLPNLVIRLVLWHIHSENISVFIIKNVLLLGMTVKKIHDQCVEIYHDVQQKKQPPSNVEMQELNAGSTETQDLPESKASVFV